MASASEYDPVPRAASDLGLPPRGVAAVDRLLGEGNTVPFVARYRKEMTGGLDEVQIRAIAERCDYLRALEARRAAVLESIAEQGKLTDELRRQILQCQTKAELEDLYLPYKKKRRTRATMARERGLEPLAKLIWELPDRVDPAAEARRFVDPARDVADVEAALAGARDIIAERVSEDAEGRARVRRVMGERGVLVSKVVGKRKSERTKFEQYYDFREPLAKIPSHRYLALCRGESEKVLRVRIEIDEEQMLRWLEGHCGLPSRSRCAGQLREAIHDAYRRLIAPSVGNDVRSALQERSDRTAVEVFADNLRNLLLAAPLGSKRVVGIDPGLRTGCKCVALDQTGRYLDTTVVYLHRGETENARKGLTHFIQQHRPDAVAVGNGTGGREAEAFARKLLADLGLKELLVVSVNESGASIYSASDVAREEHPDLDLTVRGAISIARRLQDPLAELVKLEPKSIGVGQYQHDVHQPLLHRKLGEVVESCVNHVGVELNTASASLLGRVAGIGPKLAKRIVGHRVKSGAFRSRSELLKVSGLGPKVFEQAAGFLRIRGAKQPLDGSAVHPERYQLVQRMAADLGVGVSELVGNGELAARIEVSRYSGDEVGEMTLRDIVAELKKPGRDPRAQFEAPRFRDDVTEMEHLEADMVLEGVVTNVTAFGAFVDVGVHQDGLVHVSQLADRFVKDPAEVVKVGDRIEVRVLEVDLQRRRIALSARKDAGGGNRAAHAKQQAPREKPRPKEKTRPKQTPQKKRSEPQRSSDFSNNPFASLGKKKR